VLHLGGKGLHPSVVARALQETYAGGVAAEGFVCESVDDEYPSAHESDCTQEVSSNGLVSNKRLATVYSLSLATFTSPLSALASSEASTRLMVVLTPPRMMESGSRSGPQIGMLA
jgi:hypothetical protein